MAQPGRQPHTVCDESQAGRQRNGGQEKEEIKRRRTKHRARSSPPRGEYGQPRQGATHLHLALTRGAAAQCPRRPPLTAAISKGPGRLGSSASERGVGWTAVVRRDEDERAAQIRTGAAPEMPRAGREAGGRRQLRDDPKSSRPGLGR
ncbi:unnamed protein product [Arctogadus glacialis]